MVNVDIEGVLGWWVALSVVWEHFRDGLRGQEDVPPDVAAECLGKLRVVLLDMLKVDSQLNLHKKGTYFCVKHLQFSLLLNDNSVEVHLALPNDTGKTGKVGKRQSVNEAYVIKKNNPDTTYSIVFHQNSRQNIHT